MRKQVSMLMNLLAVLMQMPIKGLRFGVFVLLKIIFQRDSKLYYTRFYGTDIAWILVIKNLLRPSRFMKKVQYGTIKFLPDCLLRGRPVLIDSSDETSELVADLERDGVIFFPNAFPDIADHITNEFRHHIDVNKPDSTYNDLTLREIDQKILDFIVNKKLLQIMASYYNGRQPYLRAAGGIKNTNPDGPTISSRDDPDDLTRRFNTKWHYDTVNMLQIHFLLHDLDSGDTHMQIAGGENRRHRVNLSKWDYYYSDEYVNDNYNIIPVCGGKGTVVLWDSNAPHRANLVVDHPRSFLQLLFTPGNDMLASMPIQHNDEMSIVDSNIQLDELSPISREALRYVI